MILSLFVYKVHMAKLLHRYLCHSAVKILLVSLHFLSQAAGSDGNVFSVHTIKASVAYSAYGAQHCPLSVWLICFFHCAFMVHQKDESCHTHSLIILDCGTLASVIRHGHWWYKERQQRTCSNWLLPLCDKVPIHCTASCRTSSKYSKDKAWIQLFWP